MKSLFEGSIDNLYQSSGADAKEFGSDSKSKTSDVVYII